MTDHAIERPAEIEIADPERVRIKVSIEAEVQDLRIDVDGITPNTAVAPTGFEFKARALALDPDLLSFAVGIDRELRRARPGRWKGALPDLERELAALRTDGAFTQARPNRVQITAAISRLERIGSIVFSMLALVRAAGDDGRLGIYVRDGELLVALDDPPKAVDR